MARINQRYRQQAARQARAEYLPQRKSARRSLHGESRALRSEEAPLEAGLEAAEKTIRHTQLTGADKAQLLASFAGQQAQVPEGIANQLSSAREQAAGTLSDLSAEEGASRGSILSGLLTAAATRQQEEASDVRGEERGVANTIKTAELEKALGLGDYATTPKTPTEEAQEKASLGLTEADTAKARREAHGNGLTPYEQAEKTETTHEDHTTAAYWAKHFLEEGKSGKLPEVPADPKEWTAQTWNHLVGAVAHEGKVPVAAAEKAVGAVRNHFEPQGGDPWNIVGHLAQTAAGAVTHSAPTPTTGAASLLSLLPELHGARY